MTDIPNAIVACDFRLKVLVQSPRDPFSGFTNRCKRLRFLR